MTALESLTDNAYDAMDPKNDRVRPKSLDELVIDDDDDDDIEDSGYLSRASAPESNKKQQQYETIGHRRGRRRPRPGLVRPEESSSSRSPKSSSKSSIKRRHRGSILARFLSASRLSKRRNSTQNSTASGDTGVTGEADTSSAGASDLVIDTTSATSANSNLQRTTQTSPMFRSLQHIVRKNTMDNNGLLNNTNNSSSNHSGRWLASSSISSGLMNSEEYQAAQAQLQNVARELENAGNITQAIEEWNLSLELAEEQNDSLTSKTEIMCMLVNLHLQTAQKQEQEEDQVVESKSFTIDGDENNNEDVEEELKRRRRAASRQSRLIMPGITEKYHLQAAKRYLHRISPALVQPAWLGPPTRALMDFFCHADAWELAIIIADQLLFQGGQQQDSQQLATMHYQVASQKLDAQRSAEALQHLQATVTYMKKVPTDCRDMTLYIQVLHLLATEYQSQQQHDSALETYNEQMVHSPNDKKASLHCKMAQVYIAKGQLELALKQIERAKGMEKRFPDDNISSQVLQTKGDVFSRLGRLDESLECYQQALHEMENPQAEKAKLLYTMGRISIKLGRTRNAITYFTKELEITKQELGKNHLSVSRVLHELAKLYDEGLGEHKMALMKYNKALHIELAVLQDCHAQIAHCPNCNQKAHRMCTKHANLQRRVSAQIRETKRCQGRTHFKLGDFERAMQTSFVER